MSFEDKIKEAGGKIVYKDRRYFAELDDNGNLKGIIEEVPQVDINGNPINPHVIVGKGRGFRCYKDNNRANIEKKVRDKDAFDVEIKEKK